MSIHGQVAGAFGTLVAVPSVHYRMAFAHVVVGQAIRAWCGDPGTAVAVELGAQATGIIASWIKDLGASKRLPCMLGLLRRNRLVHPRHRSICLALQEQYGVPLQRVPAGELLRSCEFSPTSLICLSAVDSMIEAIRSAVEHGLDVYGIDLEESATGSGSKCCLRIRRWWTRVIPPTWRGMPNTANYRDDYVDGRREWHMAGQLRFLLSEYPRVLFVGGLAHWLPLQRLLQSPDPRATPPSPTFEDGRYTKVIVDPNLAICQMDVMPNYTSHYEDGCVRGVSRFSFPDPFDFLADVYKKVM